MDALMAPMPPLPCCPRLHGRVTRPQLRTYNSLTTLSAWRLWQDEELLKTVLVFDRLMAAWMLRMASPAGLKRDCKGSQLCSLVSTIKLIN